MNNTNLENLSKILDIQNVATIKDNTIIYPLTHLYQENGPGKTDIIDIERQAHISTSNMNKEYQYKVTTGYLYYIDNKNQFIEQGIKYFDTLDGLQKYISSLYCSY